MKVLERRLGMWSVVIISISAMLGSGVFVLPGLAVGMTGGSAWLAYAAVALCALPAALAKAELASALPQSGGAYVFINQAFGPLTGTVMGIGLWASLLLKSAFALVGFSAYLRVLNGTISTIPLALGLLLVITAMNLTGIKKVSQFQNVVVFISLSGLAALITISLPMVDTSHFQPLFREGALGFSKTVAFVFVSYAGVTKVTAIAGEVKDPGKNLPRAIILSLALITPLYCLIVFALNGVLGITALEGNIKPIHTLAVATIGPVGGTVAAVIAILTMTSMANAGLLASSRFPFAMSRDGLIPPIFGTVHQRFLTPTYCILATSCVMGVAIVSLDIERIVKLASACMLLEFAANNVALVVLRTSKSQWYKPEYHSPLYPALPIAGTIISLLLLVAMGEMALWAIAGISVSGSILYIFYGRQRSTQKGTLGKMAPRPDVHRSKLSVHDDTLAEILSTEAAAIVAVVGKELSVETLTHIGTALCDRKRVEVVHITEVPDQMALDELLDEDASIVSMRRRVMSMREMAKSDVKFAPMVSHDVVATVHALSSRMHSEWLVMTWQDYRFFNPLGWLYNHLPNNLALFKNSGIRYIRRILVLPEAGPLNSVVAETSHNLATYFSATLTFTQYLPDNATEAQVQESGRTLETVSGLCKTKSKCLLLRGTSEVRTIVNATEGYDLFVIASRPHNQLSNIFFKTIEDHLTHRAVCSVLLLKSPHLGPKHLPRKESTPNLAGCLNRKLVGIHHQVEDKSALFQLCAERFAKMDSTLKTDEIYSALCQRENAQNTGVCHGVAMPHATIPGLNRSYLLIELLAAPLDYDAPDNTPVDMIFATIGPPEERPLHLTLLATLSKKILTTQLLEEVRGAQSKKEIYTLVSRALSTGSL